MLKKITLKSQILGLLVFGLVLLSFITVSISVTQSKEELLKNSYDKLTAMREVKKSQIETFFAERIGDINVLARSDNVKYLANDLNALDSVLNIDPKGRYPVEDPLCKAATQPHEEFFQKYLDDYGYYDVFLIDAADGHVVYTAAKESDYGANLANGPLKNSGLGEVWKKALANKRPTFVDMKPYAPSADAPAMFVGAPVYLDGELSIVLVFQISDEAINKIMRFRKGAGESEEAYLVGEDGLMRSDSYLDPQGHSLKASFANPSTGSVDTQAVREAFAGKTDTKIIIDYNNNPVLSAFTTVAIGEDFK